jgi:hypothetical protein
MKTIETKIYTFDELSNEAKENAREWWRNGDDMPLMSEYMYETLYELLKKSLIKCDEPKIYHSLAYCQGDGAMFEGECVYKKYTIPVKHAGMYYHERSTDIGTIRITKTGEYLDDDTYESIEKSFEDEYIKVCKALAREGYEYIENEHSDEVVDENLRANDYTFTESGKRFG